MATHLPEIGLTYPVYRITQPLAIDGRGTDPLWKNASGLEAFIDPWNEVEVPKTSFRSLWDDNYFYFLFMAEDSDIVAEGNPGDKKGVLTADRVEIFFKADGKMQPYYCLEMDPWGRVLDYKANFYRKADFDWAWPESDLFVLASITPSGYIVEGKISISSLNRLKILNNAEMEAGLFRGEFSRKQESSPDIQWISWIKPDSEKPDFHIPSAFGRLELVE